MEIFPREQIKQLDDVRESKFFMSINSQQVWELCLLFISSHGDLVLSGFFIRACPNPDILGVKFESKLTLEDHMRDIISRVSQRICILRLVKRVFVDTSLLFRCYFAFVLPILEYCCSVWKSVADVIFSFSNARCIRWPGCALIRVHVVVSSTSCWWSVYVVQG